MGSCIGFFKKKSKEKGYFDFCRCVYFHDQEKVEFEFLVDGDSESQNEPAPISTSIWNLSERISSTFLRKNKNATKYKKFREKGPNVLQPETHANDTSLGGEGTQLLPLDAHTLLASRAVHVRKYSCSSATTPPSSIDLEWENEGLLHTTTFSVVEPRSGTSCGGGDTSSGAGGVQSESPASLEWDLEDSRSEETERLLLEIERLTQAALQETNDWR